MSFFLQDNATQKVWFLICLFKLPSSPYPSNNRSNVVSLVCALHSSSLVGTLKQFSPGILKFSIKHKDTFTLNCCMVPHTFSFIFHAGSHKLGSKNFQNSSNKEKTAGSARVFTLSFCFL